MNFAYSSSALLLSKFYKGMYNYTDCMGGWKEYYKDERRKNEMKARKSSGRKETYPMAYLFHFLFCTFISPSLSPGQYFPPVF